MSRIEACFNAIKEQNKKALIPFITAGDPSTDISLDLMHELAAAGADIIELGIPFSDPMADGPVIQRASERALLKGTNSDDVFDIVKEFRKRNDTTPIVLMGYLNPIEVMGYTKFAEKAANAGVDGLIIVDSPPEESEELLTALKPYGIDQIFLISPTTRDERIDKICEVASGFLYYVSLKGVTGSKQLDVDAVSKKVNQIRSKTSLAIGVGFGIKDAHTAEAVGRVSDAVVVGSALVERIAEHAEDSEKMKKEISSFIGSLRNALDSL
ncbi:MAG TPA: tryptophan synthase subunit alpha [Thiotrichaceae bacterium]|jgi:tryptophan synthase alpha chain|nr:tryptophan synthase subunit alpha [Thiotrichaceae bacterium]HIM08890.1 tryptophan synthase subunit alpha [Gammaproteobacteria bacterium]